MEKILIFKKTILKRVHIYVAVGFMFVDMLLFAIMFMIGRGYILLEPKVHSVVMSQIGNIWNFLHQPVDAAFRSLSFNIHVALCFLQMFFVGLLIAMLVNEIINRIRTQQ